MMETKKTFWLHFDLDFRGDYENLYRWLDEQGAEDCGDNLALLKIEISQDHDYSLFFKNSLKKAGFKPNSKDRIYLVWKTEDNKMKGTFLFGERKKTPQWAGYSRKKAEIDSE